MFILVLVGHDKRTFSLQIKKIKDITPIVQCVKDVSTISFPCILLLHGILIAFSKLALTVNTQPATACWGLAMEELEQYVGVFKIGGYVYVCEYVYVCVCMYVYSMFLCICIYMYICMCIYVYMHVCVSVRMYIYMCMYMCVYMYSMYRY